MCHFTATITNAPKQTFGENGRIMARLVNRPFHTWLAIIAQMSFNTIGQPSLGPMLLPWLSTNPLIL
jgi:hypothetical protein